MCNCLWKQFQVLFKLQINVLQYGEDSPVSICTFSWWWIFLRCCFAHDMYLIDFTLLFGALDWGPGLESANDSCPLVLRRRTSYNYIFLSMILCDSTESSYLFGYCRSNRKFNTLIQQQLLRRVSPFSYLSFFFPCLKIFFVLCLRELWATFPFVRQSFCRNHTWNKIENCQQEAHVILCNHSLSLYK